jgi:hypothetical protein
MAALCLCGDDDTFDQQHQIWKLILDLDSRTANSSIMCSAQNKKNASPIFIQSTNLAYYKEAY